MIPQRKLINFQMHFNRTCYAFQHSSSIKYMRHYFSTKDEMSNTEHLRSRNFNQNYIKRISFGIHTAEPPDDWVCFRAVVLNVIITWELLCISCPELLVTVGTQLTRRCVVITTKCHKSPVYLGSGAAGQLRAEWQDK